MGYPKPQVLADRELPTQLAAGLLKRTKPEMIFAWGYVANLPEADLENCET